MLSTKTLPVRKLLLQMLHTLFLYRFQVAHHIRVIQSFVALFSFVATDNSVFGGKLALGVCLGALCARKALGKV